MSSPSQLNHPKRSLLKVNVTFQFAIVPHPPHFLCRPPFPCDCGLSPFFSVGAAVSEHDTLKHPLPCGGGSLSLSPRSNRATERCPFPVVARVSCSSTKQQSSKKTNWSKDRSSSDWMYSFHVAGDAVSQTRTAPSSNKRLRRCHRRRRFVDKRNAVSPGVLSHPNAVPRIVVSTVFSENPAAPNPYGDELSAKKNCPWTPATAAAEITAPSVQRYSPSPR